MFDYGVSTRYRELYFRYLETGSQTDVAQEAGISRTRVGEICGLYRRKFLKQVSELDRISPRLLTQNHRKVLAMLEANKLDELFDDELWVRLTIAYLEKRLIEKQLWLP